MNAREYNQNLPAPGAYAAGWRELLRTDPAEIVSVPGFIVGMPGWPRQTVPAGHALRRVRQALQSRINARAGFVPHEPREGEVPLRRDAVAVRAILTRRLRVYQFETAQARARLSHLLARHDD